MILYRATKRMRNVYSIRMSAVNACIKGQILIESQEKDGGRLSLLFRKTTVEFEHLNTKTFGELFTLPPRQFLGLVVFIDRERMQKATTLILSQSAARSNTRCHSLNPCQVFNLRQVCYFHKLNDENKMHKKTLHFRSANG